MITPYSEPTEVREFLPLMTLEEMQDLLQQVKHLFFVEKEVLMKWRLLENKGILEKAIIKY